MNKIAWLLILSGTLGWSDSLRLEVLVAPVDQAPIVDGSGKDACWKEASETTEGRWTVKAVEQAGQTYVWARYEDTQTIQAIARRRDDPAVFTDERIEIAVMDRGAGGPSGPGPRRGRSSEVAAWRMVVTPQAVYDAKQTQKFVEEWTSDLSWEADVKAVVKGKRWDIEWTMPSGSRNLSVWRRGSKITGEEPLKVMLEEEGRRNRGSEMSFEDRRAVMEKQAFDPETRDRANHRLDLFEASLALLMNPATTYENYWVEWERLGQEKLGEEFSGWQKRLADLRRENPERTKEQFDRRREAVTKNPDRLRQEMEVERALVNASSLEAFQSDVSSRMGKPLQALTVSPGDMNRPNLSFGYAGMPMQMWGNPNQAPTPNLSKGWQDITEDQYQSLRKQRLMQYTSVLFAEDRGPAPRFRGRP